MQLMLLIEATQDPGCAAPVRELSIGPLAVLREPWVTEPLQPLLARHQRSSRWSRRIASKGRSDLDLAAWAWTT